MRFKKSNWGLIILCIPLLLPNEYDLLIIEDDPYGKLNYDKLSIKPIKSFDDEGRVIFVLLSYGPKLVRVN